MAAAVLAVGLAHEPDGPLELAAHDVALLVVGARLEGARLVPPGARALRRGHLLFLGSGGFGRLPLVLAVVAVHLLLAGIDLVQDEAAPAEGRDQDHEEPAHTGEIGRTAPRA